MGTNSNYITTYRKDYTKKNVKYERPVVKPQEFKDPISESFKNYLTLGTSGNATNIPPEETADNYLEKFKELYPKLGKIYFSGPINKQVLERSFVMDGETIYQTDYCDKEKDKEYLENLRNLSLMSFPPNWKIPLTTQTAAYRNVMLLDPDALKKKMELIKPMDNLKNQDRILQILGLKTGESEYSRYIGKLGKSIVEDHLHGMVYHPQF